MFTDKRLHKLDHYLRALWDNFLSEYFPRQRIAHALSYYRHMSDTERAALWERVYYYNRLDEAFSLNNPRAMVSSYQREKSWAYHLDFRPLIRCFAPENSFNYLFGDITEIPAAPTFLKSRPISNDRSNANSVLLKLNRIRHYYIADDKQPHQSKIPMAVWRGSAHLDNRKFFLQQCYGKKGTDIGDVSNKSLGQPWHRPFMSIPEQLQYRFIISVEGNDVASNLKWIMASNSLCLMTRPKYETWFMEGKLIPGQHYIQLQDDYADLEEKIAYYYAHPQEAEAIIRQAKDYLQQFFDPMREFLISLLVMDHYFRLSSQHTILPRKE